MACVGMMRVCDARGQREGLTDLSGPSILLLSPFSSSDRHSPSSWGPPALHYREWSNVNFFSSPLCFVFL